MATIWVLRTKLEFQYGAKNPPYFDVLWTTHLNGKKK